MTYRLRRPRDIDAAMEAPTVNLTPLIDVVFVVLIMFIIIAPILQLEQLELADGGGKTSSFSTQETSPISIHVRKDNTIWYNKQQVTTEELFDLLEQARQRYPGKRPQLFQDRRAQFGIYQSVKNTVEAAGFAEMDIILKPA